MLKLLLKLGHTIGLQRSVENLECHREGLHGKRGSLDTQELRYEEIRACPASAMTARAKKVKGSPLLDSPILQGLDNLAQARCLSHSFLGCLLNFSLL